jgi:hypothetical protein
MGSAAVGEFLLLNLGILVSSFLFFLLPQCIRLPIK